MLLSIVITTHDEGRLLHKTLLSVVASLRFASILDYEILIHADRASSKTKKYLSSDEFRFEKVKIYSNSFGDPGESRNFCIKKARGTYIYIIDGDDLISENFLSVAFNILKKNNMSLVHPEYCLSFEDAGNYRKIWAMVSSKSRDSDAYTLFEKNKWISSVIGSRDIFIEHPYRKNENGYGNEDYMFNTDTVDGNIYHLIAPNTVYFYRIKESSQFSKVSSQHLAQQKSDLFDMLYWRKHASSMSRVDKSKPSLKRNIRHIYVKIKDNEFLSILITPLLSILRRESKARIDKTPISFVNINNHIDKISVIEHRLHPDSSSLKSIGVYCSEDNNIASDAYMRLCMKSTMSAADYIFFVSHVSRNKATAILINYIRALKEINPNLKIAVITTSCKKNRQLRCFEDVCLFNYGNLAKDLYSDDERDILLTRLITQLGAKKLHIIGSETVCGWVYRHKLLVKSNYDIKMSIFNQDVKTDIDSQYIKDIKPYISRVFTNSNIVPNMLVSKYGFSRSVIKTFPLSLGGGAKNVIGFLGECSDKDNWSRFVKMVKGGF